MWKAKVTKIERDGFGIKATVFYTNGTDTLSEDLSVIDREKDIAGKLKALNEIETKITALKSEFLNVDITIVNDEPNIEGEAAPVEPEPEGEPII